MKKKVLIIMPSMNIGGAERSLLGLLDSFDYDRFDVSLFLYRHEGELLPYINDNVDILTAIPQYATFDVPIKTLLFSNLCKFGMLRLWAKLEQLIHKSTHPQQSGVWMYMQKISKCLQGHLPSIPGRYDLGIMFLGVSDTLVNKVNAKVKIAWNHTDYTTLGPDKSYDRWIFNHLDYIVSVSEQSKEQFLDVYPDMKEKAIVIENILSEAFIKSQAEEAGSGIQRFEGEWIFLSVGRFSYAKNFDNIPEIAKKLADYGVKFKWYLIGYGGDEPIIRQNIKIYKMEEHVVILGKRVNPYPYIKKCDIYIQPSRFEGKSVSVREAQILGKPVIITNYASSSSQLEDGVDGVIVPLDNEGCAKGIYKTINNKELLSCLAENLKHRDYSNKYEIKKVYGLFDE